MNARIEALMGRIRGSGTELEPLPRERGKT
jgi:hypothetical protein